MPGVYWILAGLGLLLLGRHIISRQSPGHINGWIPRQRSLRVKSEVRSVQSLSKQRRRF